jgi:hypothetical protein
MKLKIAIACLALVVLGAGAFFGLHTFRPTSAQQTRIAALEELRDSGVITPQEYDSRVQALRASAPAASAGMAEKISSLKELRDSGVITAQEYDAKVQALQASVPAPTASATAAPAAAAPATSSALAAPAAPSAAAAPATSSALAAPAAPSGAVPSTNIDTPDPKVQKNFIRDPVLNMDAYVVFLPARWHLVGAVMQGSRCIPAPFAVFRVSSPDGLTVMERLPRMDWVWGNDPSIGKDVGDCLPIQEAMSAKDFLKYISATLKVEYLGEEAVPQDQVDAANKELERNHSNMAKQYAAAGMQQPTETVQLARATVRYTNGSFTMKGLLAVTLNCSAAKTQIHPGMQGQKNSCHAEVQYEHAPEAQYDAAMSLLDPHNIGAVELAPFTNAWIAGNNRQTQANLAQIRARGAMYAAQSQASADQFAHSQAVRQQMHEEFLSTMKRGTTMSMNRSAQIANTNHTVTSDWVDYSLDRQTVRDPNTGQVTKVSSSNSYTWLDSSGKVTYQTNDPYADPNGALQGNWTRQQVVHGDGAGK